VRKWRRLLSVGVRDADRAYGKHSVMQAPADKRDLRPAR
jgi:hypothetical protein